MGGFHVRHDWPLYTVYPGCTILFWLLYIKVWDPLTRRLLQGSEMRHRYNQLTPIGRRCWKANCCACVHSVAVVVLLLLMFANDEGGLRETRLRPYYNAWGYSAVCVSLAYFSFAIPWQHRLFFWEKRKDVIELPLVIHHLAVVLCAALRLEPVSRRLAAQSATATHALAPRPGTAPRSCTC